MTGSMALALVAAAVLIGIVGVAVGALWARTRYGEELARLEAGRAGVESRLADSLRTQDDLVDRLSQEQQVTALVAPLQQTLAKVERELRSGEQGRVSAQAALREQVDAVRRSSEDLRSETAALTTALRAPQIRGRWGEHQLQRIVEAAGMLQHCDFSVQESSTSEDGTLRPDLVVRLAGGKQVVVDAKVPFIGFLEAAQATDDKVRAQRRAAHARHVRDHVTKLAAKSYWARFSPSPEFVVMFVPVDAFLTAAMDEDPGLLDHAFSQNVVIATPSTLVALLRTIAYAWREHSVTENAREVLALGRELHGRLVTMGAHFGQLGRELSSAVVAYNKAVGSVESRVLVTARRLADLQGVEEGLPLLPSQSEMPRRLSAPELVTSDEHASAPPAEGATEVLAPGHSIVGAPLQVIDARADGRPPELVLSDAETAAAFPRARGSARRHAAAGDDVA